jgi:hypothetical protein
VFLDLRISLIGVLRKRDDFAAFYVLIDLLLIDMPDITIPAQLKIKVSILEPQTHGFLQHWLFGSQSLVQTEACTQMGSRNCSGMGDSYSGSPEGLRCSPLLCGRKLFF